MPLAARQALVLAHHADRLEARLLVGADRRVLCAAGSMTSRWCPARGSGTRPSSSPLRSRGPVRAPPPRGRCRCRRGGTSGRPPRGTGSARPPRPRARRRRPCIRRSPRPCPRASPARALPTRPRLPAGLDRRQPRHVVGGHGANQDAFTSQHRHRASLAESLKEGRMTEVLEKQQERGTELGRISHWIGGQSVAGRVGPERPGLQPGPRRADEGGRFRVGRGARPRGADRQGGARRAGARSRCRAGRSCSSGSGSSSTSVARTSRRS